MKRRIRRNKFSIIFHVFSFFLLLLMSSAYSLLNQDIVLSGNARIVNEKINGSAYVVSRLDEEDGLFENVDGSFSFVGDFEQEVHNFIQVPGDSFLWRILSIDKDGNLKLIRDFDESLRSTFMSNTNSGWENSFILENLQHWYQQSFPNFFSFVVSSPKWLVTEVSENLEEWNFSVLSIFTSSSVGLIRLDEVINSSASGFHSDGTISSWLNDGSWWTMSFVQENERNVWRMDNDRPITSDISASSFYRPVIYLESSTVFSGGNGTLENPFVIDF